jgi:hypothetical protein
MSAILESVRALARPAEAAQAVGRLNDRLARLPHIPPAVADEVREIAAGVTETALERWEQIDPHLALIIHRGVLEAASALQRRDAAARDRLRVALESLRQGFSAIAEQEPVADERPPDEVARWLLETTGASQAQLARMLGVNLRRLQRWVSVRDATAPEGEDARRIRAVARLVNQLRFSLTGAGALAWFEWPRRELEGRRPLELMADPASLPLLMAIAAGMRSTSAG